MAARTSVNPAASLIRRERQGASTTTTWSGGEETVPQRVKTKERCQERSGDQVIRENPAGSGSGRAGASNLLLSSYYSFLTAVRRSCLCSKYQNKNLCRFFGAPGLP